MQDTMFNVLKRDPLKLFVVIILSCEFTPDLLTTPQKPGTSITSYPQAPLSRLQLEELKGQS